MRLRIPIVALSIVSLAGCAGHGDPPPGSPELPAATVRVQQVELEAVMLTEEVSGTIRATREARLEAKVPGRIEVMRAVPGQSLRAGQLVVRLALGEFRAKLDQALAVQHQADTDLERFNSLFARGAATRAELDAAVSRAQVAAAAAAEARVMLGHSEIVAPFDGVVTRKLADVGDLAVPGRPLVEIEDPTALRVEADVGESLIDRIEVGQELEVRVPGVAAALRGTVTEIAPTADRASRTFVVKADLQRVPGVRAGTFARIAVSVSQADTLRIPATALVERGQLEFVFVAKDGKAELRLVKTGKGHGDEVELLAGVSAGERVVVSGAAGLRDGQPLRIEE